MSKRTAATRNQKRDRSEEASEEPGDTPPKRPQPIATANADALTAPPTNNISIGCFGKDGSTPIQTGSIVQVTVSNTSQNYHNDISNIGRPNILYMS